MQENNTTPLKLNSINFLTEEEIKKMIPARMEITHRSFGSGNKPRSDRYSAELIIDDRTKIRYPLDIDNNQFAIFKFSSANYKSAGEQFYVEGKFRIIETKWPAKENSKEHSSYLIHIYVNDLLKWEASLDRTTFIQAYLAAIKAGALDKSFAPLVRLPGKWEAEETSEELPNEDLPF